MLWFLGFLLAEYVFPEHLKRERVAVNSTYAGTCALTLDNNGGRRNIATFTMRAHAVNINIIFRGYEDTTPYTIALEMPKSGIETDYSIVSYTTTLFGSEASQMRSPSTSEDKFVKEESVAVFSFPFAQRVYNVAGSNAGTWYDNAKSVYKRHWPKRTLSDGTQSHYGPYPAQRFMTTLSYNMNEQANNNPLRVTGTAAKALADIKERFSTKYGETVFDVSLSTAFSENDEVSGTVSCTVTIPLDYDIGWDAWAISLSAVVGISSIILVSIFKCCPCACILKLYNRKPKETCESMESTMVLDQSDRTAIESAELTSSPPGERTATR